jgi:hypothetical protein
METPKNKPQSNSPSPAPIARMTRTQHAPEQPFIPAAKVAAAAPQAQSTAPIIGINKIAIGDPPVKATHHTPEKSFIPTPQPPKPSPEPPKK